MLHLHKNIPQKERIVHEWYLIVYQDPKNKYNLSATFNQSSYKSHIQMIKSFGTSVAVKEGTTKEEKDVVGKLIARANTIGVKNLEAELLKLNFTLPR